MQNAFVTKLLCTFCDADGIHTYRKVVANDWVCCSPLMQVDGLKLDEGQEDSRLMLVQDEPIYPFVQPGNQLLHSTDTFTSCADGSILALAVPPSHG